MKRKFPSKKVKSYGLFAIVAGKNVPLGSTYQSSPGNAFKEARKRLKKYTEKAKVTIKT